MPFDEPFLFAIAGLSASLAGLAGLVAGLRRGERLLAVDQLRLRQIVEWSFANALFALAMIPLTSWLGVTAAVRVGGLIATGLVVLTMLVLLRRIGRVGLPLDRLTLIVAATVDLTAFLAGIAAAVSGELIVLQVALLALVARPMGAFLLVLSQMEKPGN
ncbi:MAG: hypothetical protein ACXWQ6_01980 [Candidatus Limnocylindrales bacterium]